MDLDEIQRKFPRISNGDEDDGESRRGRGGGGANGGGSVRGVDLGGGIGGFYGWASSRIVRVSRASGGKDRHSKVLTSKGPRDRRVRLSVTTAVQFYDLQDRLGYDQPSKAVEWLLKAAASSIAELPPMDFLFPDTPKQLSDEKMTKSSACSSNSETSKSSSLLLSRSESRIKARDRAKGRFAEKEKEKENESSSQIASLNPLTHTISTSFTELLSAGMNSNNPTSPNRPVQENPSGINVNGSDFSLKSRIWSSTPMEYFNTGPGQMHFGNSPASMATPLFSVAGENQTEIQQFSFVPNHFVPSVNSNSNSNSNHNNGTISSSANSSGLAAYNGGTLQSNSTSPSLFPYNYFQRFSLVDGSSSPSIFLGTAAPVENHHQFLPGFDDRLQLSYGDPNANNGARDSSQKGKGKN